MKQKTLILKAPAKINLGISIAKKLPNGYHQVSLVFSQVSLFDQVFLKELKEDKILVFCNHPKVPRNELNTVYQAAKIIKEEFGITKGVEIKIKKRIPLAGGLAGGSSDAAQTLIGLNILWGLDLSQKRLLKMGARVGLDVCYQILGGTMFETQGNKKGGQFRRLAKLPQTPVVICNPDIEVESAWAYRYVDYSKVGKKQLKDLILAIKNKDLASVAQNLHNDFEYWVPRFHPVIKKIKYKMIENGALGAVMSGSGPTVFALCPNLASGRKIYRALKKDYPTTYLVETL